MKNSQVKSKHISLAIQNEHTGFEGEKSLVGWKVKKAWLADWWETYMSSRNSQLLCYVIGQMKGEKQSGQKIGEKNSRQD